METDYNSSSFSLFIFFILWFVFSFRDFSVGSDTYEYVRMYELGTDYLRGTDHGYTLFAETLNKLGFTSRQFLIVVSFLICFPVWLFIKKCSDKKMMSYFFYITIGTFTMHMSGIRQSIAMGLIMVFYVIACQKKRLLFKLIIFVLGVIIANTFHYTAKICYCFIPIIWLSERDMSFKGKWVLILLIIPLFMSLFSSLFAPLVNLFMRSRYEDYEYGSSGINIIAFFVIPYLIFAFLTVLSHKYGLNDSKEKFCYWCSLMYAVSAAASLYMPILGRVNFYFSLPTMVLIPSLISKMSFSYRQFWTVVLSITCFLFFVIATVGGIMRIDNYRFAFY